MKKIIIAIFTVIFTLSFMFMGFGCKGEAVEEAAEAVEEVTETAEEPAEEAPSGEPVTIRYLGTTEIQDLMLQELVPLYEEETGVKVEMELLSLEEGTNKMKIEMSKGSPSYDMFCHHTYNHSVFLYNGWAANLDELAAKTGLELPVDDMSGTVELLGQVDGVNYAVPLLLAILGAVQYRTDLFEDPDEMAAFEAEYGYPLAPPANWDEYADISKFFTRDTDNDGEVDFWGNNTVLDAGGSVYDMWLIRYIGKTTPEDAVPKYNYLFNEGLEPRFNSPAGIEAIQEIADLYNEGYTYPGSLSANWAQIVEPQSNGQSAMCYMWVETMLPSMVPENSQYAEVSNWAPMPYDVQPRMEVGGWVIMINPNSENQEEAYKFLLWAVSPETEYKLIKDTEYFKPPLRGENKEKEELFEGAEVYRVPLQMLDEYEVIRELFLPEVDLVQVALNTELQRVVTGEKTAEEALNDAADQIVADLEDAGAYDRVNQ